MMDDREERDAVRKALAHEKRAREGLVRQAAGEPQWMTNAREHDELEAAARDVMKQDPAIADADESLRDELERRAGLALGTVEDAMQLAAVHREWAALNKLSEARDALLRCTRPPPTPAPNTSIPSAS